MKKWKALVFVSLLVFILAGCQKKEAVVEATAAAVETTKEAETTAAPETTVEVETIAIETEAETFDANIKKGPLSAAQESEFDVQEGVIKLTLPESWRDSYYYNVYTSKSSSSVMVVFYESKDYHKDGTGWLCSVRQMEGNDPASYSELEYFAYLGEVRCSNGVKYGIVAEFPTDVQASPEHMELYSRMYQDVYLLLASMEVIDGAEFIPNPGYYGYFDQMNDYEDTYYDDDDPYYYYDEEYAYEMAGDYALEGWQTSDMQDGIEEGFLCLAEDGSGVIYTESLGTEMLISWYDAGDDVAAIRLGDDRYEGYYYPELGQIRVKIGEKIYYFAKV